MSEPRLSHDEYYLRILREVTQRSTCGRRAVGAILVDRGHHILSTGYNGVPRGWPHCTEEPCDGRYDKPGDTSRCHAVHAEANALLQCYRLDMAWKLYVSCTPCFECTKILLNTNIQEIVTTELYADERGARMWRKRGAQLWRDEKRTIRMILEKNDE